MANGPTGQPPTELQGQAGPSTTPASAAQPRGSVPGVTTRIIRDPQFGHLVEVHELAPQATGLEPAPARRAGP